MQSRNVNDAAEYHFKEGQKLKEQGKYADAIVQYSKAIALDKANADIYHARAYAHNELKKYCGAIVDLNIAIQLNPNNSVTYNNRGYAYGELEKHTKAIADYDMAISIWPSA